MPIVHIFYNPNPLPLEFQLLLPTGHNLVKKYRGKQYLFGLKVMAFIRCGFIGHLYFEDGKNSLATNRPRRKAVAPVRKLFLAI
jgi:hypothetical protein